jgi:Flp pilus assembly CpaF family ATPase
MRTKDGVASLSDLVRSSLRLRPDRIPIGEVRGSEALDLLKAWGTGHPGVNKHSKGTPYRRAKGTPVCDWKEAPGERCA